MRGRSRWRGVGLEGSTAPQHGFALGAVGNQRRGPVCLCGGRRNPAHPNVEPLEKVRPAAAYMLSIDDVKEFPKYEKLWKEIFQIR